MGRLCKMPEKEELSSLYSKLKLKELAKHYSVSTDTIKKWLKLYNLYRYKVPLTIQDVQRDLDTGMFLNEIAEKYNYSEATLSKFIRKNNLIRGDLGNDIIHCRRSERTRNQNLAKSGGIYIDKENLFCHIIEEGLSYPQIAKMYNCSESVVGVWARIYGIKRTKEQHEQFVKNYVNRGKETTLSRYGVFPYGLKNYPKNSVNILRDKSKFNGYLLSIPEEIRTWSYISSELDIPLHLLHNYYNKYECDILMYSNKYSSLEEIIRKYLDQNSISYRGNARDIISPKELDFYISDKKIAIEVNGTWSHSTTSSGKYHSIDKYYHLNKHNLCKDLGIQLIHIYEYELLQHEHKILQYLDQVFNVDIKKIYARRCELRIVDNVEARLFLNNNHLQGYKPNWICLGLYANDDLVQVMSFSKPRFNKNYDWELLRLATKSGYRVVGGASKLFSYFVRTFSPKSIVSYCNIDKFRGAVYEKLGFRYLYTSPPNYVWVKAEEVLSRYQTQKHKLSKILGEKFDNSLSESENMIRNNYNKIYDCGNDVYEWRKE